MVEQKRPGALNPHLEKISFGEIFPAYRPYVSTEPIRTDHDSHEKLLHFLLACTGILPAFADDIDVVLIGGQSNATGQAYVHNLPVSFKIDPDVLIYYSKGTNRGQGSEQWKPLCPAAESLDRFGVELTLGTELHKLLPNRKIALIKHARSGSNLYEQWNPGNRPGQPQGTEYAQFMETVNKGMAELRKQGHTPTIRAMVWQQGEADAHQRAGMENSNAYSANLTNFIAQVRKDTGAPNMLFVYGTVLPKNFPIIPAATSYARPSSTSHRMPRPRLPFPGPSSSMRTTFKCGRKSFEPPYRKITSTSVPSAS